MEDNKGISSLAKQEVAINDYFKKVTLKERTKNFLAVADEKGESRLDKIYKNLYAKAVDKEDRDAVKASKTLLDQASDHEELGTSKPMISINLGGNTVPKRSIIEIKGEE